MNHLGRVLEKYRGYFLRGGGKTALDVDMLRKDLEQVRRTNVIFFWVSAAMILVLFLGSVGVSFVQLGSTGLSAGLPATLGVGSAFLIRWMVALWREKSLTEMLIVLAIHASREDVLKEVMLLVERFLVRGGTLGAETDKRAHQTAPATPE